ncbi:hypothetical protein OA90_15030 [Labrenzia sp. OB1]|nr:hypothetical protein OA90_15030 [Labrenzia sp. OB1]
MKSTRFRIVGLKQNFVNADVEMIMDQAKAEPTKVAMFFHYTNDVLQKRFIAVSQRFGMIETRQVS